MDSLFTVAAEQLGLFTRKQARTHGFSDRQLRLRVESGLITRLNRCVFHFTAVPMLWETSVLAACLTAPTKAVASHRAAARVHGIETTRPFDGIEISVAHPAHHEERGVTVHQTRSFEAVDHTVVGAIPVTTIARTLIDLGAVRRERTVEDIVDAAERDRRVKRTQLQNRFDALHARGRNGIATIRSILEERDEIIPGSILERRFLRLLESASLPRPTLQHPVRLANGRTAYIDVAYVPNSIGFEIDGHRWHATRSQRMNDNRRWRLLADLGWDIRRFTYEEICRDGPSVVAAVRSALRVKRSGVTG